MKYDETIDKLFSLQKFGIKLGLSSTENLLEKLGRPHEKIPILHLAGTNGKGSVGASVTSILSEAGYKVGFYTSPHLVSFRERFVIGGDMINANDVVDLAERVWNVCVEEEPPTFFEFVTAMAFLYFAEADVDLAVMETGLGGRLDATNVATPIVSVITNISLEHTEYLGPTLAHIAMEKAGIIKTGVPVITGEKRPGVKEIFRRVADEKNAGLIINGRDFRTRRNPSNGFNYYGLKSDYKNLETALLGRHQVGNAALALAAVELLADHGLKADEPEIRRGLKNVRWPGRAELLEGKPSIMLDGAHNPAAARVLGELLAELEYDEIHVVMGVMADKDIDQVMAPIVPFADKLYLTRPEYIRAAEPSVLKAFAKKYYHGPVYENPSLPEAIEAARDAAGERDLVLITGSLFTVGEARGYLLGDDVR